MIHFISFTTSIKGIELPKKFTFPFYYEPHRLAKIASEELQNHLTTQTELNHSFGINNNNHEIGKMFGVLVVENHIGKIGYLAAFSGNIEEQGKFNHFVPPVYDILTEKSFYKHESNQLITLSEKIDHLEKSSPFKKLKDTVLNNNIEAQKIINFEKEKLKTRKKNRKKEKNNHAHISKILLQKLAQESLHDKFYLKELICYYENKLFTKQEEFNKIQHKIRQLKQERNKNSNDLHQKIFNQYHFLNIKGEEKSLNSIFKALNIQAPAGTGDCAAPKLLQYAFLNDLKPIAMAEFWWGKSSNSAIRKHKNYYPSCKGKCEPILSHMLKGMEVDENPLLKNLAKDKSIEFLFEDDSIIVINKPTELLSVNGKDIKDSVYSRLAKRFSESEKHLIVHRLDMSTSGIMLITKTKKANQFIQNQFINRTIKKKYIALLDGIIHKDKGEICLPLRVDLNDRPRQLVCFKHGKNTKTIWKVIERKKEKTIIEFTPITGRTHQLRVHSAHIMGLNTAIIGDDLYGKRADRLYLHASYIQFVHPFSKKVMEFSLDIDF